MDILSILNNDENHSKNKFIKTNAYTLFYKKEKTS